MPARCHGKDATYWAGGRGVAIRFVPSLVLESRRVGSMNDLRVGAQPGRSQQLDAHKISRCPIGSARRASERGATWTRQVSPSSMGMSSCRAIDRVVAVVPGQSCHCDGLGPTGGS